MNIFFIGSWVNESERGTNKSPENRFTGYAICLSSTPIRYPMNSEKDTHSLNELMLINTLIHVDH